MRRYLRARLMAAAKLFAQLMIRKFRPGIIGVTGTVGKTSTKEAIYRVLLAKYRVRRNLANLNNEFGLSLAVLGNYDHSGGLFFWLKVFTSATIRLLLPKFVYFMTHAQYPEMLVLEYAADRPGDLKYLIDVARPNISVVTAVGDIPVHVEFYENADAVAREKSRLVEALLANGTAILNADDPRVAAMKDKTRARVMTYGFSEQAQVKITNLDTRVEVDKETGLPKPIGISFKLESSGTSVPVRLSDTAGATQAYAAAAAACVGIACSLNPVEISNSLLLYKPPAQRMNFLNGINNTILVDDSYNASPLSMTAAIDTIKELPAMRKVAVVGDMRELGTYTEDAHREIGKRAASVFDVVVSVGAASRRLDEAARSAAASSKQFYWFENVQQALPKVKEIIKEGDLILVKASHSIGLEVIVAALRKEKERIAA